MAIVIYPYHPGSKSAKLLSEKTGWKRMKRETKCNPRRTVVVNWGSTNPPARFIERHRMFNENVKFASNKLVAFERMKNHEVVIPDFTTKRTEAQQWLLDGERVLARTILNGHSGAGIVNLYEGKDYPWTLDEVPEAPLYTKYIKKNAEYRVHVFWNQTPLIQQKKKRNGVEVKDKYIRSHRNGYVFCKTDIVVPPMLSALAVNAVQALELDFGAVDIIEGKDGTLYVLEVNSAPGLDNKTAELYANHLKLMTFGGR